MLSASAETLVGELPGEFTVNNLGAASYTVPLSISPGTAGVEPRLAIRYSSRGGNGLLGVGFALDGLSSITRIGTSLAQDGFIDGVDFDANDRFALDGQRLMLVSTNGAYGDAGTEYRTEIESFSRVVAAGQSGSGPASFKVWTKSGLIYEYGGSTNSAFQPGTNTTVLSWAVSKVSDTLGNYMTFTYDQTSGGPLISRIDYTGNAGASLSPYSSVEFVYEERPDDKLMFFRGVQMEQTNRLSKIVMKSCGSYMHDYRLNYTTNEAGQSVMDSLQQFFGESAGADCLPETTFEFSGVSSATNFSYSSGTNILQSGLTYSSSFDGGRDRVVSGDLNGDGMSDLVCMGYLQSSIWTGISRGDGSFSFECGTNVLPSELEFRTDNCGLLSGDFDGDGKTDLCGLGSSAKYRWSGLSVGDGTFAWTAGDDFLPADCKYYTGREDGSLAATGDFNGDGLTDICSFGDDDKARWVGISDGDGSFTFTKKFSALPSDLTTHSLASGCFCFAADFNGDGLADIASVGVAENTRWVGLSNGNGTFTFVKKFDAFPSNRSAWSGDGGCAVRTGDFNGDGLADICSIGDGSSCCWLGLSEGDGTFTFTSLPSSLSFSSGIGECAALFRDYNGDGLTDICSMGNDTNQCFMGFSKGDGTFDFTFGPDFSASCSGSQASFSGDFNGDGMTDLIAVGNSWSSWLALNGNEAARLETVTQGYQSETEHGVVTEIEYAPITDTNIYIKGSGAKYPIRDIISPIYVVSDLIKDNAQGGEYRTQYAYRSARYHVHGRGFLGFQQFISYDCETDLCYVETLSHEFPIIGRRLKTETLFIPDPSVPDEFQHIKQVDNDWFYDQVDGGSLFAYTAKSVETKWELGITNAPATVVTAYNWFDFQDTASLPPENQPTNLASQISHGNLVKSVIDYGGGLKKTTLNSYDDLVTADKWLLGRLDASTVTHEASNQTAVVRSSSFDYVEQTGLLDREVIEPSNSVFELITDYTYDDFGNITNKTLTPAGLPARAILANTYDTKGRFVEESRNALGHLTTFVNDQALGKPLAATDPNGLTTEWSYDPTGRLVCEQRPDGTSTTNSYHWDFSTTVTTPLGTSGSTITQKSAYYKKTESDGTPAVSVFFDKQGREIRLQTQSADGRTVNTDTGYNAIAQPVAVSEPYFAGSTPLWSFTEYDGLGRPQTVTAPDGTVSEMVYEGLTTQAIKDSNHRTTGTTPKHQVTTTVKNVKDEVLSVTSYLTASTNSTALTISYTYDPVGNLICTTDPENNVIEMDYDLRGNKIWQSDPDMGVWNYTYNALDQLISQEDANGNIIQTAYDVLGRAVTRTNWVMGTTGLEVESTAHWFYDGTGEGDKLGSLRLEEHRDGTGALINRKRYAYDELSRPVLELMNYDGKWYYTGLTYDAYSRVKKTHRCWKPKGKEDENLTPEWNRFTTVNFYNERGALLEVRDTDNHTWWAADASDYDQYGRLTGYEYGNGLVTTNGFNPLTGRLTASGIISSSQFPVSDYQFGYDRLGNLTSRSHERTSGTLSETCTYDSLNRLVSTINAATNTTTLYDSLGNITARSDVGTYLYGTRPHAVSSVSSASSVVNYSYDLNGNILSRKRDGVEEFTAEWTSFNKPSKITSDENKSEFEYSVDGRRTRQLIIDGTNVSKKVYATPAYEMKEVLTNPTETNQTAWVWEMDFCRIYVDTPAGKIGIYQHTPDSSSTNNPATVSRSYIHKDHLGSVIATSDSSANITYYLYDAWGNRRDPDDWFAISTFNASTLSTDRGFTGHEMLGHLDLIHMNGRIYDPVIGRMISPDPLIPGP